MGSKPYRILLWPDTQIPFQDQHAVECALSFAQSREWDAVLIMGDFLDIYTLSRFVEGRPGLAGDRQITDEFELGNTLLDRIQRATRSKKKTKCFYLKGNHEHRVERYVERHTHLQNILSIPQNLHLKDRGITWVDCEGGGEVLRLLLDETEPKFRVEQVNTGVWDGHGISFIHGKFHGVHVTTTHATKFGRDDLWFAHTHTVQDVLIPRAGQRKGRSVTVGCLCDLELEYVKDTPTRWQHAIAELTVVGGDYSGTVHRIHNGMLVTPEGSVYG